MDWPTWLVISKIMDTKRDWMLLGQLCNNCESALYRYVHTSASQGPSYSVKKILHHRPYENPIDKNLAEEKWMKLKTVINWEDHLATVTGPVKKMCPPMPDQAPMHHIQRDLLLDKLHESGNLTPEDFRAFKAFLCCFKKFEEHRLIEGLTLEYII